MTEEIIIDGVNVAGCMFYEPKAQVMTCHEESITKRCDITNCYYKKLKKLEQKNKELKEELKSYKHPDVVTLLTNWRTGELDRIHNKIANERDTYRSALEEIKNLVLDNDNYFTEDIEKIIDEVLNG